MKTFVVLAVSIVLVSILFCPIATAFPTLPADLNIVQPDPSLPKELAAFFGKWWFRYPDRETFVIVEKIDEEKASIYVWRQGSWPQGTPTDLWTKQEARVSIERGKYKLTYQSPLGESVFSMKGDHLASTNKQYGTFHLKRVH